MAINLIFLFDQIRLFKSRFWWQVAEVEQYLNKGYIEEQARLLSFDFRMFGYAIKVIDLSGNKTRQGIRGEITSHSSWDNCDIPFG